MNNLTAKQKMVYDFFIDYLCKYQKTPSIRAVAIRFGFNSDNSAHTHIKSLIKKGYLKKVNDNLGSLNIVISEFSITKSSVKSDLTEEELNLCDMTDDEFKQKYMGG